MTIDLEGMGAAFLNYLRTGASGTLDVGTSGVQAPAEVQRLISKRLFDASPMREIATVRTMAGGMFNAPVTDPATLQFLAFSAADLYASPAATQTLLDDAMVDLDDWLAAAVEDAFAAQETAAFVSGTGTNQPKGFLSYEIKPNDRAEWGEIGSVEWNEADPVDGLIDLIYAPNAQYRANARFVMNRRTAGIIRKFKDADGNYVWSPATQPGATSSLLGYPVTEIEQMPDMGSGKPFIAFGDFRRGYLIVDRAGVRVLRDPYTAKPYVLFYTTKRVGGGVQNFDAIKVMIAPECPDVDQAGEVQICPSEWHARQALKDKTHG